MTALQTGRPQTGNRDAPSVANTFDHLAFDYVAVGHVTIDLIADAPGGPLRQPGGGAFYSTLQAARLGLRSAILTCGRQAELEALLEPYGGEFELRVVPAAATTTLHTTGSGPARRQRLMAWAGPIRCDEPPLAAGILHLAPVAQELSGDCGIGADFIGLTPQGLVRSWSESGGALTPSRLDPSALPARCDAAVLSETERPYCEALLRGEAPPMALRGEAPPMALRGEAPPRARPLIAVTAGPGATTLLLPDSKSLRVTPPAIEQVRDDLGAGDVFAAAFFVALREGRTPAQAATFGNAAAAAKIIGEGPDAVGDRDAIEAVLARSGSR